MSEAREGAGDTRGEKDPQAEKDLRAVGAPAPAGPSKGDGDGATLRWVASVAGADLRWVGAILAASVVQSVLGLSVAWALGAVVDRATGSDQAGFGRAAALLVVLLACQVCLGSVSRWLAERTRSLLEERHRARVLDAACSCDLGLHATLHSGEWLGRMWSDARVVAEGVADIVPGIAGTSVRLVGAICMLVAIVPESAVLLVGGGAALGALATAFRSRMKGLHRAQQEAAGRVRSFSLDCLQGLLVVHTFVREAFVGERARALMRDHREARLRRAAFSNLCNTGFAAAMDGAYVLGVCYCGWRLLQGTMGYGTLMVVAQLVALVQGPFANISGYLPRYYAMLASAERLMEVESWPDVFDGPVTGTAEVAAAYGRLSSVRLSGLSFSYGAACRRALPGEKDPGHAGAAVGPGAAGADALLAFPDLEVRRGEAVALVGRSGCGKSTLLKLLMGIYLPATGTRELVWRDGSALAYGAKWRGLFAYVPQDDALMAGTVRDVVSFGEGAGADDARVWEALEVACADGFVRDLPRGLDAELGERGAGLSGGQQQRLAIARAVYSGHPIVVLDEATSALDRATEGRVLQNLRALGGRTIVLVTHRRQAAEACDRTIELGGCE